MAFVDNEADAALSYLTAPDLHWDTLGVPAEPAAWNQNGLSWGSPEGVGAGLQNTGNSCYLNAALQCLTHTPPLAKYMLSRKHSQGCCLQGDCMMCAMEAHVTQSLLDPGDVLQPSEMLTGAFHKKQQEDAHEFLMFTLNAMQESCFQGSKHSDATHSGDSTLIQEIFGGSLRSQIKCLHCQGTSDSVSPFLDMVLDINAAHSVKQALEGLVIAEELCGENAYICGQCQAKTLASKTVTVQTAPKVLLLLLNRFSYLTGDKVDRQVSYPESLDLQPYLSQPNRGPLLYALYAVLVHVGVTGQSGHYFCYVKAGDDQWYKMDDSEVTRCDVTAVLTQPAYVLFYVQEDHLTKDRDGGPLVTGNEAQVQETDQNRRFFRGACAEAEESHRHLDHRATQDISLDQSKVVQDHLGSNPVLKVRNFEPSLPGNAVVTHQARHSGDWLRNYPNKENYPNYNPPWLLPYRGPRNTGQLCGQQGTPMAGRKKKKKKKKKQQGWRRLPADQFSFQQLTPRHLDRL